jgi:CRISPR/Cas system-associated exonuclease Cas4 (RecB family)
MPASALAQLVGAGYRDRDKLIPTVSRHLLKKKFTDRQSDCIHPSEMANENWCPRATYYRIAGVKPEPLPNGLAMEIVFEIGNDAHSRWQNWFREIGILHGLWKCLWCKLIWEDMSPSECPRCWVGRDLIVYREVPISNAEHLIAGHMDGDVLRANGEFLPIEAKTIGEGTIRYDAPALIQKYSYTTTETGGVNVDWRALWNGIRRPFPAHLRQGMVYLYCSGQSAITYIYEPKFITAYPKEFEIKFNPQIVEPLLKQCRLIKLSLERERPPKRPLWAEVKCTNCQRCPFKTTCWGNRED